MVATWKPKAVNELTDKISKTKVVGLINIQGIPSRQFQQMRKSLIGSAEIRVTKASLMKRAFNKAKMDGFDEHVHGSMGLIFTDMDAFKLNKILVSKRTSAPAKEGSIAPKDIMIPAGDTPFAPGPIIGDLQKAGIKAQIKGPKIVITADSLVAKEGDVISGDIANVLTRLGIEPMEIGLDMSAAYEDGLIYSGDILKINEVQTLENIQSAYAGALNLALNSGVCNSTTIGMLMQNAFLNAMNLALNAEIINKETIGIMLSKANLQMFSLASKIPEGLNDELKSSVESAAVAKAGSGGADKDGGESDGKEDKPDGKGKDSEGSGEEGAASGMASLFG